MALTAAERQRKSRAHRSGNHQYCGASCQDSGAVPGEPADLGPSGLKFWRSVMASYQLSAAEEVILTRCCRVLDRLARIDYITARSAPATKGSRDNLIKNPAWIEARECERTLDILIRSLALPLPGEGEGVWRSPEQRQKAQLRWRAFHEQRDQARGASFLGPG